MAQWFNVSSATTKGKGLQGHFDLKEGEGWFQQDLDPFLDKAKEDRHYIEHHGQRKDGYRKFATIPDAVSLKILEDHHINLHDPNFSQDPNNMKKLKAIIKMEYPALLVNT